MKRQQTIIAIFALFIFAISANAQFGDFINKVKKVKQEVEKTKEEIKQLGNLGGGNTGKTGGGQNQQPAQPQAKNSDESWITISKTHTQHYELRYSSVNTLGCGDPIFATVNYREPMDNSGGYAVSMLVDGKVVLKEQMSGGSNTHVNQTIHIEVIPAEDAVTGFPQVTLKNAKNILNKLTPGNHTIQIVVSLNDYPKNIAAVEFEYTGGAGCDAKKPRNQNTKKDTTKINNNNQQQTTVSMQQQTTVSQQREEPKPEPVKPAEDPEVEIYNSCGETRYVQIERPSGSSDNINFHGTREFHRYPLGTKIYVVIDGNKLLIDTVVANPSDTSYGRQVIKLCK